MLHHNILLAFIAIFILSSILIENVKINFPSVLGISTNITSEQLLELVNQKRKENGLASLSINPELSSAAQSKARDMFTKDYWAHNSPDGKTPWVFFKDANYNYVYAGENLARGFNNAQDIVDAWMESVKHRENLLSSNYRDVGFAVETGKLNGETTILVVEELGSQTVVPVASNASLVKESVPIPKINETKLANKPFTSVLSFSSNIDRTVVGFFIFTLFLDMIIIERKKIVRFVGHNIDHMFFLIMILLFISLLSKGAIV